MTAAEAKRLLHPDTTIEALAEIEYYDGLNGKNAKIAACDEACLVACVALDKQIPKKPNGIHGLGKHSTVIGLCPTCGDCGQALDWEK